MHVSHVMTPMFNHGLHPYYRGKRRQIFRIRYKVSSRRLAVQPSEHAGYGRAYEVGVHI
jgi:hypothetical protein